MEVKSISDCLNFIDNLILCSTEKHIGIGNLEDVRDYMNGMYDSKYIEEMVSMLAVLSEINLIIDRFYLDKKSDIKQLYRDLRKRILAWLKENNTKPEVDNDEYFIILQTFVKNNNKSKKYILRGQRNVRYHEKLLSNTKKSYNLT